MKQKFKLLYSQEALFHDIVGGRTWLIMQSVMFNHCNQLSKNVTKPVNLHSCPQLHIILKKRNDYSGTFRAITTEKNV